MKVNCSLWRSAPPAPPKVKDIWGKRFLGAEKVQVQTHVLSAYQGLLQSVINDKYMGGGG